MGFIILGFFAAKFLPIRFFQFWACIALIIVIYFLYVKKVRKQGLPNSQKKLGLILLEFFSVIFLVSSIAGDVTSAINMNKYESQTKSKKKKTRTNCIQ